jgi:hypothetical protein
MSRSDGIPADNPDWYSVDEYFAALTALSEKLSRPQGEMLRAHALAPDRILSVHQLAAAAGYATPNVVYGQYGRLGQMLAEALDHSEQEAVWTRLIGVDDRADNGELIWEMEPALVRTVVRLGWADRTASAGLLADSEAAELSALSQTDREALVLARLGQGQFRAALMRQHAACMVTGITEPAVLRASHIKPWRDSTNDERLDPANGLLLAAHLDALFDSRLISFSDDGSILISADLSNADCTRLGLTGDQRLKTLRPDQVQYLHHHRQRRLRGSTGALVKRVRTER